MPCPIARKVTSLAIFGDSECRRGVLHRPIFTNAEAVYSYLAHQPPRLWKPATLTTAILHRCVAPAWPEAAVASDEWHKLSSGRRRAIAVRVRASSRARREARPSE